MKNKKIKLTNSFLLFVAYTNNKNNSYYFKDKKF